MDGSFQDLHGDIMGVKVDEFHKEMFKMQRLFQKKQNKVGQEVEKTAGITKKQPNETQESPTIMLCSTVLEQIKEFKVLLIANWVNV